MLLSVNLLFLAVLAVLGHFWQNYKFGSQAAKFLWTLDSWLIWTVPPRPPFLSVFN